MLEMPRSWIGIQGHHPLVSNGKGPPPPLSQGMEGDDSLEPHWNVIASRESS